MHARPANGQQSGTLTVDAPVRVAPRISSRKTIRILTVFGTRPEAIKLAPVVHELYRRPRITSKVCVTAQHRDMLDQVLEPFGIVPDHDLDLMKRDQALPDLAASVLQKLAPVLESEKPDWVIVQGDTTTAAIAALAAFYHRTKVAHVEAGLRSHDKWQPFPEEINRRIAGIVADVHFAPTEQSKENLLREGVPEAAVRVTGNTIIDALQRIRRLPWDPETLGKSAGVLKSRDTKLILVTAHRRENFGEPIIHICQALRRLAETYPNVRIVYPVHKNPNIWEPVQRLLGQVSNIFLLPPVDYLSLVQLMKRSYVVLTDSGGIQEEAPALGVPALVLREVTERPEGVASGNVKLVGSDTQRVVAETSRLLDDPAEHLRMACAANPYGDGHAAKRIASILESL